MIKTNPSPQDVDKAAQALRRELTDAEAQLMATYLDQLIKWNRKMNLVGKSTWRIVFDTLIIDSLYLADFLSSLGLQEDILTLDLGAGAGLPGIPLRCLWQPGDYRLVEVREKRSLFMRSVLGRLKLPGTAVFHGRAEDALDAIDAGPANLILSRAFMPWKKLLGFTGPMLAQSGVLVILSNDAPPEAGELSEGWQLVQADSYQAGKDTRYFWALRKA